MWPTGRPRDTNALMKKDEASVKGQKAWPELIAVDREPVISLVGNDPGFCMDIHPNDEMYLYLAEQPNRFPDPVRSYFESGDNMMYEFQGFLAKIGRSLSDTKSFLEFACGYGRFTRFLTRSLLPSKITVSDIADEAVDFQIETFRVRGFCSQINPLDLSMPQKYEMVFAASFFSHLPLNTWRLWFRTLYDALDDSGVLIFSTHGPKCIPNPKASPNLDFLYEPKSESKWLSPNVYGTTYVTPEFVRGVVLEETGELPILEQPQGLWKYQDVYAVARSEPGKRYNVRAAPSIGSEETTPRPCPAPMAVIRHSRQYTGSEPVFIVGCARSGTSVLANALIDAAGLRGWRRGHLFPLLSRLLSCAEDYYAELQQADYHPTVALGYLPEEWLRERITELFAGINAQMVGYGLWVDRTTDVAMIRACPLVAEIYPKARFIFVRRRGIDNILSRQRKFPEEPFRDSCEVWATGMGEWLKVRDVLGPHTLEVDQRDVALEPGKIAREIASFLQLEDSVVETLQDYLRNERPEQSALPHELKYLGIDETGWSAEQKALFKEICGSMLLAYGYQLKESGGSPVARQDIVLFYPTAEGYVKVENVGRDHFARHGDGFLLHPNVPGASNASVCYPNVPFEGQDAFSALVLVNNAQSQAVRYSIRATASRTARVFIDEGLVVKPEKPVTWRLTFSPLRGRYDVTISTSMAPEATSNTFAWAVWERPCFTYRDENEAPN